ncbi:MAG: hypothetical protein FVQ80_02300 [Planctomycetes bacterium]|nr:hypothetical protein [Planctomycetota bacterium]
MTRKKMTLIFIATCLLFIVSFAYGYDANDFATEVVSYDDSGAGIYNISSSALGRPSIDTTYYGAERPLVTVIQADGTDQVVTIGATGHLTLKFNHRVADDKNNAFGIDFIVFGNAFEIRGDGTEWDYTDPNDFIIHGDVLGNFILNEDGIVSVSQDGITWYTYDSGPFADSFAPTLGRIYDPRNPVNVYPGWDNQWWGMATDPTIPLDPNLTAESFDGNSVAEMCLAYVNSAGGTGFDLKNLALEDYLALTIDANSGERWIQYIKIECADTFGIEKPEVDAVSDVGGCGDYKHPYPQGDINGDCRTDMFDVELIGKYWLVEISEANEPANSSDLYDDDVIDIKDWAILSGEWPDCTWDCN